MKQTCCVKENTDFISGMAVSGDTLLATSGDGSLTVLDLRQRKMIQRSDCNESELLSLAIVKVCDNELHCVSSLMLCDVADTVEWE